jgi:alpha-tubulin suppressor-like RCC1 family protein
MSGLTNATVIAAGDYHTCARVSNGSVQCWGNNSNRQLGIGSTNLHSTTPAPVAGLSTATDIAAGYFHTCATLSNGIVQCWGLNSAGQLGDGTTTNSPAPITVNGITASTAIDTGRYHTCALHSNGSVQCWGLNSEGQLGDGSSILQSTTPVTVSGITTATAIAAGDYHTCALLSGGSVQCWGGNFNGQIGNGTFTRSSTPVAISGLTTAIAIATGGNHTCALLFGGSVQCWGENVKGQLGNGTFTSSSTPVPVSGLTTAIAIATGGNHTCALLSGGSAQCWGDNFDGQLGNGTIVDALVPVPVVTEINTALSLIWTSSIPAVATINASGRATALVQGTTIITAYYGNLSSSTLLTVQPVADTDNDGVPDGNDNCINHANANQYDSDSDKYGNRCDADLNQSNLVNAADLALFKSRFGTSSADADLDGSGLVNAADLAIFKALFGKAPGPSGLAP